MPAWRCSSSAEDSFNFFAAWESLTIGSYFLILRGRKSEPHALSYLVFSLGGAFLILAGFALAGQGISEVPLSALSELSEPLAPWVFLLLAVGFMTKTAAIGLHIWLPGAHAEAETDVSPMVSGILLKAGLFGLFVLLMHMGRQTLYGVDLTHAMMWIGALSALLGNLMAVFQEDAKRLLAYSSIGQMGYALFGLAMMNHLGWLMALMFVVNHYIYKSMLFLSVGGVAKRTGTRAMYQMGGLITLMPLSFIAVLIGIIAMSGVPPLSGFGGRWIFYNAIMTADYRLPMVLIFLSGPIAFLYLFRLIHTIFLGQLKDEHRRIKEAPFWLILPQMIYVVCLLAFAAGTGPGVAPCRCLYQQLPAERHAELGRPDHHQPVRLLEPDLDHGDRRRDLRATVRLAVVRQSQGAEGQAVQHRVCRRTPLPARDHALRLELLCPLPQGTGLPGLAAVRALLGPGTSTCCTAWPTCCAASTPATARCMPSSCWRSWSWSICSREASEPCSLNGS